MSDLFDFIARIIETTTMMDKQLAAILVVGLGFMVVCIALTDH